MNIYTIYHALDIIGSKSASKIYLLFVSVVLFVKKIHGSKRLVPN